MIFFSHSNKKFDLTSHITFLHATGFLPNFLSQTKIRIVVNLPFKTSKMNILNKFRKKLKNWTYNRVDERSNIKMTDFS